MVKDPRSERIAELLHSASVLCINTEKPFTWTNGQKAPFTCDNRILLSVPRFRSVIVEMYIDMIKSLHIPPEAIAGLATGAVAWAAMVADRLQLPLLYVRSARKEYGRERIVEGQIKPGAQVVMIDDVLTSGTSCLRALDALSAECKVHVTDFCTILDYGFPKTRELLLEKKLSIHSMTTLAELLNCTAMHATVPYADLENICEFLESIE